MIFFKQFYGGGGDGLRLARMFTRDFFQKIIYEQRNVVATVTQRRQMNAHNVQAIKQIFAKLFCRHGSFERLVRGGDDAHIHFQRRVAADAFERAGLQHAQDFRLRRGRHIADFIEENRAVIALLKFTDALDGRAGERAFFVAEQFAFQKLFGNRGAIDGEKRLRRAVAVMIDRAGYQFLARAAFAGDERGRVGCGNLADEFENALHRSAAADDAEFVIFRFEERRVGDDLLHVARGLERIGNDFLELGNVKRLEQIIVSAELHRFDGGLRRAVSRHQNDEQLGIGDADFTEGFHAGHAGHAHVHQHEVGLELGNDF